MYEKILIAFLVVVAALEEEYIQNGVNQTPAYSNMSPISTGYIQNIQNETFNNFTSDKKHRPYKKASGIDNKLRMAKARPILLETIKELIDIVKENGTIMQKIIAKYKDSNEGNILDLRKRNKREIVKSKRLTKMNISEEYTGNPNDSKIIRIQPVGVNLNGKITVVINDMKNESDSLKKSNGKGTESFDLLKSVNDDTLNNTDMNKTQVVNESIVSHESKDIKNRTKRNDPIRTNSTTPKTNLSLIDTVYVNESSVTFGSKSMNNRPKRDTRFREAELESSKAEKYPHLYLLITKQAEEDEAGDKIKKDKKSKQKNHKTVIPMVKYDRIPSGSYEYGNYSEALLKDTAKKQSGNIETPKIVASLEKGEYESEMIEDERYINPEIFRDESQIYTQRKIRSYPLTENTPKPKLLQINKAKDVKLMKNNSVEYNSKNISSDYFSENGAKLNLTTNTFSIINENANLTSPENKNGIISVQNFHSKIVKDSIVNSNTTQKLVRKITKRHYYNVLENNRDKPDNPKPNNLKLNIDIVLN